MNDFAIHAQALSKRYRIQRFSSHLGMHELLESLIRTPFRRTLLSNPSEPHKHIEGRYLWALQNISFTVKHGEAVGLIGQNGAGKSVLLKILARVTKPTEGYAELYGRVGAMLEVGTGFHPEFSGRENIYLNGAILGMKRAEIIRKFEKIVEYSEITPFLDTPVKRYSSGMLVRLAFAVAVQLEPEILLIDEVLAVGDEAFKHKSLKKLEELVSEGRTILFVSHNMNAIKRLCHRVIWLSEGRIVMDGRPEDVVSCYLTETRDEKN